MEQQTVSLKQCISELTGKQIAMDGANFIYLSDRSKVSNEVINEANLIKTQLKKILNIDEIKAKFNKEEPLTLTVDLFNGDTKEITFDCNANSGVLINSTIDLARRLAEPTVKIWDANDVVYEFNIDEAEMIRDTIAKTYLDRILERQSLIAAVV